VFSNAGRVLPSSDWGPPWGWGSAGAPFSMKHKYWGVESAFWGLEDPASVGEVRFENNSSESIIFSHSVLVLPTGGMSLPLLSMCWHGVLGKKKNG